MFNVFKIIYNWLWCSPMSESDHEQHTIPFAIHITDVMNRPLPMDGSTPRLLTPDMLERGLGGVIKIETQSTII